MLRLFAGLLGLVVSLAEIATATAQTVDGRNVTSVQVTTGRFTMTGPQRWLERRANGKTFNFVEVRRDQWSVYLLDSSRGVNLKIDLRNKQIFYSDTTSPRRPLYPIVGATAAPSHAQPDAAGEGRAASRTARAESEARAASRTAAPRRRPRRLRTARAAGEGRGLRSERSPRRPAAAPRRRTTRSAARSRNPLLNAKNSIIRASGSARICQRDPHCPQ